MKSFLRNAVLLIFISGLAFAGGVGIAELKFGNLLKSEVEKAVSSENLQPKVETAVEPAVEIVEEKRPEEEKKEEPLLAEKEVTFSFAILGDTQSAKTGVKGSFYQAVQNIKKVNPKFVAIAGDLISSCDGGVKCEEKYLGWKKNLETLPFYATMGNHDRTGQGKADAAWRKIFDFPTNGPAGFEEMTYSFDVENAHFVFLSSDKPKEHVINSVQRTWLDQDLTRNKKELTFVFFQEPAYPVSSKIGESLDAEPKERDALWAILKKHNVTAVFSGHEHIQSRRKVDGIYQLVFGNTESFNHDLPKPGVAEYAYQGTNYGIISVEGKKVTAQVYTTGGQLLNSTVLQEK